MHLGQYRSADTLAKLVPIQPSLNVMFSSLARYLYHFLSLDAMSIFSQGQL